MPSQRIDALVAQHLGHYVYVLLDPRQQPAEPFYVGQGARKVSRLTQSSDDHLEPETLPVGAAADIEPRAAQIQAIRDAGDEPQIRVVVHGLETKDIAGTVAASLIWAYMQSGVELTNRGEHAARIGMDPETLRADVGAADLEVPGAALVVRARFDHRPLPAGVLPWEAPDKLLRYNSRRFWQLPASRRNQLEALLAADQPVMLLAVASDGLCLGAWRIKGYEEAAQVFAVKKSSDASYLKRRLVVGGVPVKPQARQRYLNWTA